MREINAARTLVQALQTSAEEGAYLPGMDYRAGKPDFPVYNPDGKEVTGHPATRYPFRIRPYLENRFDGTIFVNQNKKEILKRTGGTGGFYDYYVSTFPALGMNIFGVGGVVREDRYGNAYVFKEEDCITRPATMLGSILAFASAGSGSGSGRTHGYCYVTPPTMETDSPTCQQWKPAEEWTEDQDPMNFGFVDFRYDGKAVCAFMDGSVRMCSVKELSDMRVWTRSAAEANDPDYSMTP